MFQQDFCFRRLIQVFCPCIWTRWFIPFVLKTVQEEFTLRPNFKKDPIYCIVSSDSFLLWHTRGGCPEFIIHIENLIYRCATCSFLAHMDSTDWKCAQKWDAQRHCMIGFAQENWFIAMMHDGHQWEGTEERSMFQGGWHGHLVWFGEKRTE